MLKLYWGNEDGGNDEFGWDNVVDLGQRSKGSFTAEIQGIEAPNIYFARIAATNPAGTVWSTYASTFTPPRSSFCCR